MKAVNTKTKTHAKKLSKAHEAPKPAERPARLDAVFATTGFQQYSQIRVACLEMVTTAKRLRDVDNVFRIELGVPAGVCFSLASKLDLTEDAYVQVGVVVEDPSPGVLYISWNSHGLSESCWFTPDLSEGFWIGYENGYHLTFDEACYVFDLLMEAKSRIEARVVKSSKAQDPEDPVKNALAAMRWVEQYYEGV